MSTPNPATLQRRACPMPSIEAIKSPFDLVGSRSIVAIHLKDANSFEPFMSTFLQSSSPAT